MINALSITGRLTKDPELVVTQSNIKLCNVTVAVNRPKDKDGNQKADFIRVLVFNKQAESLVKYQSKGSLIGVEGRIQTSSYDDKNGNKVFSTEVLARAIHFLEPKSQQGNAGGNTNQQQYSAPQATHGQAKQSEENPFNNSNPADIDDGDLPF